MSGGNWFFATATFFSPAKTVPERTQQAGKGNAFHGFEPCVMRRFAEKLISPSLAKENEYAGIVLSALTKISPIKASLVPENSLIREFITGGIYEEFY